MRRNGSCRSTPSPSPAVVFPLLKQTPTFRTKNNGRQGENGGRKRRLQTPRLLIAVGASG